MSWKVWKGKDARADEEKRKGENLRNQGKFTEAALCFQTSGDLYTKSNNKDAAKILYIMATLCRAIENPTSENLANCSKLITNLVNDTKTVTGLGGETILEMPKQITAIDLANETRILAEYLSLSSSFGKVESDDLRLATAFEKLANDLSMMPNEHFQLEDFATIQRIVSEGRTAMAARLRGLALIIRGNAIIPEDPSKAKEFFETARAHFRMAKSGPEDNAEDKAKNLEQLAKCWICGREVQGRQYHYVHLHSTITPYMKNKFSDENPSSVRDNEIIACMACSSAIFGTAEKIARSYYERTRQEIRAVREEILPKISKTGR